jgi:hypothetical protein
MRHARIGPSSLDQLYHREAGVWRKSFRFFKTKGKRKISLIHTNCDCDDDVISDGHSHPEQ